MTLQDFEAELESLKAQREQALVTSYQVTGALQFAAYIKDKVKFDEPKVEADGDRT